MKSVKIVIKDQDETVETTTFERMARETNLLLVSFDTEEVRRISKRQVYQSGAEFALVCPAKYALVVCSGASDIGAVAQLLVSTKEDRDQAVWFEEFWHLPAAVEELRKRFPKKKFPDQVGCLVDWPFDRSRAFDETSIVKLEDHEKEKVA